ncbi:MAG TPA: hypothetical protein VGC92_00845, partial [Phenylobacterium sp.]
CRDGPADRPRRWPLIRALKALAIGAAICLGATAPVGAGARAADVHAALARRPRWSAKSWSC